MYKALVVDDDNMIRIAMMTMIDWEANGFELIGSARDGQHAMKMISTKMPDLIITDIQMPEMNGLELISSLKQQHFVGEILILSNYNDFELVRTALRQGAYDYLLKVNLSQETLLEKINEIKQCLGEKAQGAPTSKPYLTNQVTSSISGEEWIAFLQSPAIDEQFTIPENCRLYLIRVIPSVVGGQYHMRSQAVERVMEDIQKGNPNSILVPHENNQILLIDGGTECFSIEVAEKIQNQLLLYLNLHCHIIRSGVLDSPAAVRTAYNAIVQSMDLLFYTESSKILRISYAPIVHEQTPCLDERIIQEQLSRMLLYGDINGVIEWLREFLHQQQTNEASPSWLRNTLYHLLNSIYYILPYREELSVDLEILDKKVKHASHIIELREATEIFLTACVNKRRNVKREVLDLMEYIDQHLKEHLTLGHLKMQVNLSEKYMCTIFKQETGTSIINYINEKRIRIAAELLITTNMRLKEIGEEIGIPDPLYLSKMFKKYYKVTPRQYRSSE